MATYFNPYCSSSFQSAEISYFSGEGVDQWLSQVENLFYQHQTMSDQKLPVGTFYLAGGALEWYREWYWEMRRSWRSLTWDNFAADLRCRFGSETLTCRSMILESMSKAGGMASIRQSIDDLSRMMNQFLKNQEEMRTQRAHMAEILEQMQSSVDELLPASARAGKQTVLEPDNPPLIATPPGSVSHGFLDQPLQIHKSELIVAASCEEVEKSDLVEDEYPKNDHASLEVNTIVEVSFNHMRSDFSSESVLNETEVVEWKEIQGFAKSIRVPSRNISKCSPGVCKNVSMDCSSYFTLCTGSINYIPAPILKVRSVKPPAKPPEIIHSLHVDDLRALVVNMNDYYEEESFLLSFSDLWKCKRGVHKFLQVMVVDGNFVYDKGKGHKYRALMIKAPANSCSVYSPDTQKLRNIALRKSYGVKRLQIPGYELNGSMLSCLPTVRENASMCWSFVIVDAKFLKPPAKPPDGVILGKVDVRKEVELPQICDVLNFSTSVLFSNGVHKHYIRQIINEAVTWIKKRAHPTVANGALMIKIIVECDGNDVDFSVQPNRKITDDSGGSMNSDFGNHGANVDCENGVFELISGEMQFGHHQSFVTDADTHCGAPNEYAFNSDEGQGWSNQPNSEEMISFSHTEAGNINVEVGYNGFGLDSDSKQAFWFSADSLVGVAGNESSLVKRSGRPKGSKKKVDKISEDYLVNQDQSVINISNLAQVKIDVVGRCSINEVLTPAMFQGDTKGPVTWKKTLQGGINEQKDGMPMLSELSTLEATNCHLDEASLHEVELHTARGVIEYLVLVFLENIPEGLILRQLKASTKIIWRGMFEVTYKFVLEAEITMKRLPTLAESMEEVIYITELCEKGSGSLWDQSKPVHFLKLSLDRLKGLGMLAFETAFFILGSSLVDPAFQVCRVNKFYIFSSPMPPEVADLEDNVNFKDGGMLRNEISRNLREPLVFWYNLDMYKTKCKPGNKKAMN